MRKKVIMNAVKSGNPLNSLYAKMSPKQRAAFKQFARCFGWTNESIKKALNDERDGLHHREP